MRLTRNNGTQYQLLQMPSWRQLMKDVTSGLYSPPWNIKIQAPPLTYTYMNDIR